MIPTLFFIFVGLAVLGFIIAVVNMALMAKSMTQGSFLNHDSGRFTKGIALHIIAGGIAAVCSMGAVITGIMWLVMFLKGA
jgi:hypothetical protein